MANQKLKLGIIGMSEGNGHPYSWSAIINGYNSKIMDSCPFKAIPEYLKKQDYPKNFLSHLAEVTHIYTQDLNSSIHISQASNIPYVSKSLENLIENVDAVILATDDYSDRIDLALPAIEKGLPVYIDKPISTNVETLNFLLSKQKYESQIFTCSPLRFADELLLTKEENKKIGTTRYVEASVMKDWEKYAIHLIEPIIANTPNRGNLKNVFSAKSNEIQQSIIVWDNISAYLKMTGSNNVNIQYEYFGDNGSILKVFNNPFNAFKNGIYYFLQQVKEIKNFISRDETFEIINILELGKIN